MSTEIKKAPAKPTGRKFASVDDMLSAGKVSQNVREKLSQFKNETRVVLGLAKLRQGAGITQKKMAEHLGVTQSAVSKLETGGDETVTLREIREYSRVTGQRIAVTCGKRLNHVEAIKLHAGGLKSRLEALAQLANENDELQMEIKEFFGEAFFNLFNILATCADKLPNGEGDVEIRIERNGLVKTRKAPGAPTAKRRSEEAAMAAA